MEQTRASLTDKIEALENKVVDTVHDAKAAVTDTVASVKEAVHDTVETVRGTVHSTVDTVKDAVDINHHIQTHPFTAFGLSVAAGFVGGKLLGGPAAGRRSSYEVRHPADWGQGPAKYGADLHADTGNGWGNGHANGHSAPHAARDEGHGLMHSFMEHFGPAVEKLKGMAIGTLLGFAKDMLTRSVPPQISAQLTTLVDDVTKNLGGEPVRGPLFGGDRSAAGTTKPAVSYSS